MTAKKTQIIILLIGLIILGCKEIEQPETIELDIEIIVDKVEIFGEGIVSTNLYERDMAISPNGNELIYSLGDYKQQKRCLVQISKLKGKRSEPKVLNIS